MVRNPLRSDDTEGTREALESFSARTESNPRKVTVSVEDSLRVVDEEIDVRESGTLLRFLLPLVSVLPGPDRVTLAGRETLRERSNREPLESLREAGFSVTGTGPDETVPVECRPGQALPKNRFLPVACSTTSQLLSGWIIALAAVDGGRLRRTTDLVSGPYVTMTEQVLEAAGVSVEHPRDGDYVIEPGETLGMDYEVPGDFSSAAFLIVGAALSEGRVVLEGLNPEDPQADRRIVDLLMDLGAPLEWTENPVNLVVDGAFRPGGFTLDASDCPDLVPILAVLGAVADGEATISNVPHLKNKESDRLRCTAEELREAGYEVTTTENSLTVGDRERRFGEPVRLDAHDDHRLAMAFSVLGLVVGGITVSGAECVSKSYPGFFEDLEELGGTVTRRNEG